MIGIEPALDWRVIVAVLAGLAGLAIGFNAWIDRLDGAHQGDTAWLVVIGCAFTLAGFALIAGLLPAIIAAVCFIASGVPMIVGERLRHKRQERKAIQALRDTHNEQA